MRYLHDPVRCDSLHRQQLSTPLHRNPLPSHTGPIRSRSALLMRKVLIAIFVVCSLELTEVAGTTSLRESMDVAKLLYQNDTKRAYEILSQLCQAYDRKILSGDACSRLCESRSWQIIDFHEGNKVVIVLKDVEKTTVFKSTHWSMNDFSAPDSRMTEDEFSDMVLDLVNDQLRLGWPREFKKHLMDMVWPMLIRSPGEPMTQADRLSLWSLLQQPEFVLFRVLPLTRVIPKLSGSCGHFYETEFLVAFRMNENNVYLKREIVEHLLGTLKLLYEFLNEPLQWCDVRFDNLGLSTDYHRRFVFMNGDSVFTQSRLSSILRSRPCKTDEDCTIGDCTSRCTDTKTCSDRTNGNLEVFCKKLDNLYGTTWSKGSRYLTDCNDPTMNATQRLLDFQVKMALYNQFI